MKELVNSILAQIEVESEDIDLYSYDIIETSLSMVHRLLKILNELRIKRKLPVKCVLQNRKISPDSVRFVQIRLRVGTNSIKLFQFGTDLL